MPSRDLEFFDPRAEGSGFEWRPVEGYPEGVSELVLYGDDAGRVSRLLRLEAGTETGDVLAHDFYEEVVIVEGRLTDTRLGETFTAGMCACRTPGMEHGPYRAETDVVNFEHRYPG